MQQIRLTALSDSLAETYDILEPEELSKGHMRRGSGESLVCGQCEHLISKVLISQQNAAFRNAACRCPECRTALHLTRPSHYSQAVNMKRRLKDIKQTSRPFAPQQHFDLYQFQYGNFPQIVDVKNLIDNLRDEFFVLEQDVPRIIYHYTDAEGLRGIISASCLWATDLGYMNDTSELQYASKLINEEIEREAKNLSEKEANVLRNANIEPKHENADRAYCAVCFCPDGNKLSQWRAYGDGGRGFALGFDAHELSDGNLRLRKVIYDEQKQRIMLNKIIANFKSQIKTILDENINDCFYKDIALRHCVDVMATMLDEYRVMFKDKAFEEEEEWRLIRDFQRINDHARLEFRYSNGLTTPYLTVPLDRQRTDENKRTKPNLPLIEIVRGPKLQSALHSKTAHLLLEKYRYEHVEVAASATPLRT